MSFTASRARLRAATFDLFGVAALWKAAGEDPGVAVQVRIDHGDDEADSGEARITVETTLVKVRRSQVACPAAGDRVQLTDADDIAALGASLFKIQNEPLRSKRGDVWICEAVALPAD